MCHNAVNKAVRPTDSRRALFSEPVGVLLKHTQDRTYSYEGLRLVGAAHILFTHKGNRLCSLAHNRFLIVKDLLLTVNTLRSQSHQSDKFDLTPKTSNQAQVSYKTRPSCSPLAPSSLSLLLLFSIQSCSTICPSTCPPSRPYLTWLSLMSITSISYLQRSESSSWLRQASGMMLSLNSISFRLQTKLSGYVVQLPP